MQPWQSTFPASKFLPGMSRPAIQRQEQKNHTERAYIYTRNKTHHVSYSVVSVQEALVPSTIKSIVHFIPVFNLLRQWLRMYLNMPAY
uniref:Uncharacterized protein n=1 Tax=Arundo donax TaxID=35708 RepID=A0A0A9CJV4_ARUDO